MKDAQTPGHIGLNSLITRLKDGRYVIPDFQRDFEWQPWDIAALMRSIFSDYYIGSLLLWKGTDANFRALDCQPIYGHESEENREYIVLDGQQRLTAIYYTVLAPNLPPPGRQNRFLYFIRVDRFMDQNYDDAFSYNWTNYAIHLLDDPLAQYKDHMFPLAVLGKRAGAFFKWVEGYRDYWRAVAAQAEAGSSDTAEALRHAAQADEFGDIIESILEDYQVAYISLDKDLPLDKVCDIFTQINSRGVRLDIFDLLNALLRPGGLKLKEMWHRATSRFDFVQTERMNVYILQVMSILTQAYCSPKYLYYLIPGQQRVVRGEDGTLYKREVVSSTEDFKRLWDGSVDAMVKAIALLRQPQEFGAISSQYLPYVSILPVFAALQMEAKKLPPERQLDAGTKIRHWYWGSVFTNRYSGSVESTAALDFRDIQAWFRDDAAVPSMIGEFATRFGNLDLHRETRRGTSIYNGIFNLLVIRGARDWVTGWSPHFGDLDDHHIVPKSWARTQSKALSIDSILNRTPLTWETNREVIRDRLPNEYFPELMEANGEEKVRQTLETHLISAAAFEILLRQPFTGEDFEEFLAERKRTILVAIEDLLINDRVEPPLQLRELDSQVEWTELELRVLIVCALDDDAGKLPPHLLQRMNERIRSDRSRDPSLYGGRDESLAGKLEYSDLRELQDIITAKALWPVFAGRFGTKETLIGKFDQLAQLRNRLRHSRTVDDVTRKEGEAAILWFSKVLTQ